MGCGRWVVSWPLVLCSIYCGKGELRQLHIALYCFNSLIIKGQFINVNGK